MVKPMTKAQFEKTPKDKKEDKKEMEKIDKLRKEGKKIPKEDKPSRGKK